MKYAYPVGKVPGYVRDEDGNIIYQSYTGADGKEYYYLDDEGNKIATESGEMETKYSDPVDFTGAITSQLKNAIMRAWGSDSTDNYAKLIVAKNAKDSNGNLLKLPFGARVWFKSEVQQKADGSPDEDSADYQINGIMCEALNETIYYLQVLQNEVQG